MPDTGDHGWAPFPLGHEAMHLVCVAHGLKFRVKRIAKRRAVVGAVVAHVCFPLRSGKVGGSAGPRPAWQSQIACQMGIRQGKIESGTASVEAGAAIETAGEIAERIGHR